MQTDVELWYVSFRKTNFRGNVEVVDAVGVTDGVAVAESDVQAEGVYTLELVAVNVWKELGDTERLFGRLGTNVAKAVTVGIPASATWAAATLCATADSDEIVPAA